MLYSVLIRGLTLHSQPCKVFRMTTNATTTSQDNKAADNYEEIMNLFESGRRSEALYRAEEELSHDRFMDFIDAI